MANYKPFKLSEELTDPDFAKVIFKELKKQYSPYADIICSFEVLRDIKPSPEHYVGFFEFGFCNLSECIISRKVIGKAKQKLVFYAEEMPLDVDLCQLLYIGENGAVYGASSPFWRQDSFVDVSTDEDYPDVSLPSENGDDEDSNSSEDVENSSNRNEQRAN